MSKFFSKKILMLLCVLALAGCDVFFEPFFDTFFDNFFFEESVTSKRLKEEIGIGEYKYLEEIYNGRWEKVCVLIPYSEEIYICLFQKQSRIGYKTTAAQYFSETN